MKKRTNKILVAFGVAGLLLVVGSVLTAKSIVGGILEQTESITLSGDSVEETFDVSAFSEVALSGGWKVEITEGDQYSVRITGDSALLERTKVTVEGQALTLDAGGVAPAFHDGLRAEIQVVDLSALSTRGGSDVTLRDLSTEELSITSSGASNILGQNVTVERLRIEAEGAVNAEFLSAAVHSAELLLEGAGNVEINMTGGELSGRVSGVASVSYTGTISRETVRMEGLGSVERRQGE